jgi:hypothetical protein
MVLRPLLTSHHIPPHCCTDCCRNSSTRPCYSTMVRPPQVLLIAFSSHICRIYTAEFVQYRTLSWRADSPALHCLMRFLFVRPRICLRLLSDSTSQWTPWPLTNSSYCKACSGLTPPSHQTRWAHSLPFL